MSVSSAAAKLAKAPDLYGGSSTVKRLREACSAIEEVGAPTLMIIAAIDLTTLRNGLTELVEEMQGDIEGAPETLGRDQMISGYIRTIEWLLQETK